MNSRKVTDFCKSNRFFEHKSIHRYTRIGVDRKCVEMKSMIVFMLVKKKMLKSVMDFKSAKGLRREYQIIMLFYLK